MASSNSAPAWDKRDLVNCLVSHHADLADPSGLASEVKLVIGKCFKVIAPEYQATPLQKCVECISSRICE
ncbi:hypothetical protein R1flu_006151 [Riccia fluitans]|uniref:Uncharacterized protein n=1 Tax=Riccia fluitans TaxID=41844 RepID=A0ABD1YZ97_9MARC